MNSEIVYRTSLRKAGLILVLSLGLAAGGVWMATERPIEGWAVAAFFSLCTVVSALMLLPQAGSLRLDPDGFEIATLFRRRRIPWRDVLAFRVDSIHGAKMVAIDFSPDLPDYRRARAITRSISGMEGAIPDHYNASPEEIARTLNEWRERFAGGADMLRS